MSDSLAIREITDLHAAYSLMRVLREQLTEAEFRTLLGAQQLQGYRLLGAFDGEELVGLIGARPVRTFARGFHLHVDDLVTLPNRQGGGIGSALLARVEADASAAGQGAVFLDSRAEVVRFYAARGYAPHTAVLMRKRLHP